MIKQFKHSADQMRDKEFKLNHYQVAGFLDDLDDTSQENFPQGPGPKSKPVHDSFDRIGNLPNLHSQNVLGSSFLDNDDINQAVILGEESNCQDDVDLKNTSFFA